MQSFHAPRRGFCVLLGFCAALLTACTSVMDTSQVSNTPTPTVFVTPHSGFGVPPSVAAFCPSPQTLAPIVGETMSPDPTTGTHGADTTCGYTGPSGDICEFTITAWYDAQTAQSDYTSRMNAVVAVGGQAQAVTGLGDAAFYFVDEAITVLKGSYVFFDKCFLGLTGADEHVDIQIARLLLTRI